MTLTSPSPVRLFRLLWLLPLIIWAVSAGAQAQIQLSPIAPQLQASPSPHPSVAPQTPAQTQPSGEAPNATAESAAASGPTDFAIADELTGVVSKPKFEGWTKQLNDLEKRLDSTFISNQLLDEARSELDTVRADINEYVQILEPKIAEAKAQVDNLGLVPDGGEPSAVAAQRAELESIYGNLQAAKNVAESAKLRADQLATRIQEIRRQRFTERLFERSPEAHSTTTWQRAPSQFGLAFQRVWQEATSWWENLERRVEAIQLLIIGALIAAATIFAARRGVRHFWSWSEPGEPPYWLRSTSAAWVILLRTLPVAATACFLYASFSYQGLISENIAVLAYSALRSLLIVAAVAALTATALAPSQPRWRLLPMSDEAAERIRWLVVALSVLYSFALFLDTVRTVFNVAFALTVVQSFVSSIVIAGLVIAILLTPRNPPETGEDTPQFEWVKKLNWPLWGVAILILLTALTGYIGLARFITAQLIVTGTIICVVYLLMVWVDAVGESMGNEDSVIGRWLMSRAGLEQRRRQQLSLPVTLTLKVAVLFFTVPLVLLQWGFDWQDISQRGSGFLFSFKVGQTEISIAAIFAAVVVFVIGYIVARLFQNWLDRRVLETAGISGGARHSIRTAVGYAGVVVAALVSISYAGLDLSNIALVAGALSVGIGLGLQSIVNNFVSGLILLAERPIKVGDWVVVGEEQGFVKKISVRATEIETFDRANVLIPNSSFISGNVKNWTLHNYSGRVAITVGVHYTSDARQVRDLLLQVAKAHPMVMTNPGPFVYFDDFAADALSFTLYAYTYDITESLGLRTELRIQILEAFRDAEIEIPYRQTDIHFRNLEALRDVLPLAQQQAPWAQTTPTGPQEVPPARRQSGSARKQEGGSSRGGKKASGGGQA